MIEEIFPNELENVRSVKVRTVSGSYIRDIRKVCLLEAVD